MGLVISVTAQKKRSMLSVEFQEIARSFTSPHSPWNKKSFKMLLLRSNITTSLEFFPQIYQSLLQFLEKSSKGYGRELRKFILVMQKATERAVRIASQIVELCEQNADVVAKSKNLFRMKSLES